MHIALLTNEYPPHVYGGAGVHVDYLSRALAALEGKQHTIHVLCFGGQQQRTDNTIVEGIDPGVPLPAQDSQHHKVWETLLRNIVMTGTLREADIIHCHTWYTHFAGCLLQQLLGVPLVLTTHSLEPQRPWKAEQLGSAYRVSTWVERTAYANADGVIAVSQSMQRDVHELYDVPLGKIRVIHNGIDLTRYVPTSDPAVLRSYHIDPDKPFVLFVGRISRQKGLVHLMNALPYLSPGVQVVLCASSPDSEDIAREVAQKLEQARADATHAVIWIPEMVPVDRLICLYTHASVFICPSVYEPFGIINLEAMACGTPVVASAVGGIPEAVVHGETGLLVPFEPVSRLDAEPRDPTQFARDLAAAVNRLLGSPDLRQALGAKARERVERSFSWTSIAQRTLGFYRDLAESRTASGASPPPAPGAPEGVDSPIA
jgi:glycogen synthase